MPPSQNKHELNSNHHNNSSASKTPFMVIKFVEWCLAIYCLYLHYWSFNDKEKDVEFFTTGTYCGFIVILTVLLTGYCIKATASKRIYVLISLAGTVCFLCSGIFTLQIWDRAFHNSDRNMAMSKSVVAIINGAIFAMDTIFTFLQSK